MGELQNNLGRIVLMKIFKATNLKELSGFSDSSYQLGLLERNTPQNAREFMQKLLQFSFKITGEVTKENAAEDIQNLLQHQIPDELQDNPFYNEWISDMAGICKIFCDTLSDNTIRFSLGSTRGCTRYHTDNISMRLLVTYEGCGTEWLPEEAANYNAYESGAPNDEIVLDPSAIQFMKTWDIALFRGGQEGVLHRTPDKALNQPSILMRLDPISFGSDNLRERYENIALPK